MLRMTNSKIGGLSEGQQEALRRANAARTRKRHEKMADELRAYGCTVTFPLGQVDTRWQLQVLFSDTGWTAVGDTIARSELVPTRGRLEGFTGGPALGGHPILVEHSNYRFVPVEVPRG